ncbi:hypothetical protein CRX69_14620 [Pseudomonas rhizophila]|jgi:hypothetical protein|uniref:Uncharacterized protein n=1 Tax=Pseudomonas rhizophila TaxID=2045200 RepID=A0ABM6UFQ7_9PSED|nr:hypothetical protein CRX69_14620 [Pseudomonas rhizophila]MBD0703391.1 hypothetical protein [Pseudomonas sp. PSB1]SIR85144.1 hypothetical protein SAMN05216504_2642 [Pseudomonas sp. A214]
MSMAIRLKWCRSLPSQRCGAVADTDHPAQRLAADAPEADGDISMSALVSQNPIASQLAMGAISQPATRQEAL